MTNQTDTYAAKVAIEQSLVQVLRARLLIAIPGNDVREPNTTRFDNDSMSIHTREGNHGPWSKYWVYGWDGQETYLDAISKLGELAPDLKD
jgi:hypothetical protein